METVCIAAFIIYCFIVLGFFYLWRDPNAPSLENVMKMRQAAVERNDKPLAWMLLSVPIVRIIFGSGLFAMAAAGFAALGSICGVDLAVIQQLRLILQDFYDFVHRSTQAIGRPLQVDSP